jgi:haloacetate dehalogenase
MFEGFETFDIATSETSIHGCRGGSGPPLLLLHGFPETHLMWHATAPRVGQRFTVVAADLRGYGNSGTPPSSADHRPYSKGVMAHDMILVMRKLGYERFSVAGHDRGGRCAYRMALDYSDRIARLAVLDLIPTNEAFNRANMDFALGFWPWCLLAQPHPFPETLIAGAPEMIANYPLDSWSSDPACFSAGVREAYTRQFRSADHAHAICEEYRAAATVDYLQDESDKGKRRISCPVRALWGRHGALEAWYDPLKIWKQWATNVSGRAVDCGHFIPEEAPDETSEDLLAFFANVPEGPGDRSARRRALARPRGRSGR